MVTEHVFDFGSQSLDGKGFLDKMDALVENAAPGDDIVGVAGHVETDDALA